MKTDICSAMTHFRDTVFHILCALQLKSSRTMKQFLSEMNSILTIVDSTSAHVSHRKNLKKESVN